MYFDNAATSWPKPESVYTAMDQFFRRYGANPGRGGHAMAIEAEHVMGRARNRIAKFFNAESPDRVIFTLNATDALNMAIKGMVKPGDHVISSMLEHNSVTRPLVGLQQRGVISLDRVRCGHEGLIDPRDIEERINKDTALIAVTHCSNVTGTLQPIEEIARLAKEREVPLLVDGSQSAGVCDIDLRAMGIDLFAAPGHKGLLGPTGTGVLYVREGLELTWFREGGTGSESELAVHPTQMPYRLEGGTPNTLGIAGLSAAVEFLEAQEPGAILNHERALSRRLIDGLDGMPGVSIQGSLKEEQRLGLVSMTIEDMEPVDVSAILDQSFGIATRAGLHCSPVMHEMLGTLPQGTLRFSFGFANTAEDVDKALAAIKEIAVG